jgi:hypothetical protein
MPKIAAPNNQMPVRECRSSVWMRSIRMGAALPLKYTHTIGKFQN